MIDDIVKTRFYKVLETRTEEEFITKVKEAYKKCKDILGSVSHVFNNYTMHNEKHALNTMEYMSNMITDINVISSLDIVLCIYAALFHDIGMVVYDDEISKIEDNEDEMIEYDFNVLMEDYGNKKLALQEAIRPIHGRRVRTIFERDISVFADLFKIPNTNISFMDEVISICQAHNEDFEWLKGGTREQIKKGPYDANPQFVALLLRLGDLLDIDEQRAPQYLYQLLKPSGISDEEWRQHFILENNEKVGFNTTMNCKEIQFYGQSTDVNIHRKFLSYIDYFEDELTRAISFSEKFTDKKYALKISSNPKTIIKTTGFSFAEFKLKLDYNAVTNLLMGENIYGDKKYGLRELLQNSIDACKVLVEFYKKKPNTYEEYNPKIRILVDQEKKLVSIFDNGKGMSLKILKDYFLNVGVSYYKSKDYRYKGYNYNPIGNYGIGFLACFMLSKNVKIITKQYGENEASTISIDRDSEYVCFSSERIPFTHGTEIILNYDDFIKVFKNDKEVKSFIEENFILDEVSISLDYIKDSGQEKTYLELKTLNDMVLPSIDLSPYLNDIDIYADVKFSKSCFFKHLKDLTNYNSYYFDEERDDLMNEVVETFDLKEYIEDDKIKFMKVAIIKESIADEFNLALNFLDFSEEALRKITPDYIAIIYKADQEIGFSEIEDEDTVIESVNYNDLITKFGQSKKAISYIFDCEQKVVVGENDVLLGFEKDKLIHGEEYWRRADKIYCKDILVSNAHLSIPYLLNDFKIRKVVMNSKHKDLIPNVTRNDFSEDMLNDLSYAVGKALHMWILDNQELNSEEKKLIELFVKKYYSKENKFYKDR